MSHTDLDVLTTLKEARRILLEKGVGSGRFLTSATGAVCSNGAIADALGYDLTEMPLGSGGGYGAPCGYRVDVLAGACIKALGYPSYYDLAEWNDRTRRGFGEQAVILRFDETIARLHSEIGMVDLGTIEGSSDVSRYDTAKAIAELVHE